MKSKGGTRVSVMGQGSAGSALKGTSAVLAGQGYAPSLSAQMSALAGFQKQSSAMDAVMSAAKMSVMGQGSAGSALKGMSAVLAGTVICVNDMLVAGMTWGGCGDDMLVRRRNPEPQTRKTAGCWRAWPPR